MAKAKRNILPFFIPHQGCPNQCIFCNQHRITGIGAAIDFAAIEQEILQVAPGEKMEIAFYGGSFSGLPQEVQQRLLAPAYAQKEKGVVSHIRISTRPDYIDGERLLFLQQYGVDIIEIGAQSFSDRVLVNAGRGHSSEDIFRAATLIKEYGFQLIIQLLPGLPGDSYETAVAGGQTAADLQPAGVRIYPAVVLADTPLCDMYHRGVYQPLTVTEAVIWCRDMAAIFLAAGIDIIRIGLQPTEELCQGGTVVAGAFHPAFGQLTQSALALAQCQMLLKMAGTIEGHILVPERLLSTYIGQKRANLLALCEVAGRKVNILSSGDLPNQDICYVSIDEKGLPIYLTWQDFLCHYIKKIKEHSNLY
ncbi:MAG: radical SAM protein [Peptococcaceae bacterium]|nr:radical SAM protein [Peptococcaceae bacterium]